MPVISLPNSTKSIEKGGRPTVRRSVLPLALLAALTAVSLASAAPTRSGETSLTIVGYSIPTAVFPKLTAAYQATPAGNGVNFASSFAASDVHSKAVARWDVMAAYGALKREGKSDKQALAYLKQLFQHNVSQDTSGRNALNTFLSGRGDVLLDYESDAKLAQSQGKPVYYLIPKATLQIETPLAAVNGSNKAAAQKFVNWLYTPH